MGCYASYIQPALLNMIKNATVAKSATVQVEGNKEVENYNLDVINSIRINGKTKIELYFKHNKS